MKPNILKIAQRSNEIMKRPSSEIQPEIQPEEQLLGQFIPLHYHFNMLQDEDRVGAFRSAIRAKVRKGSQVVELGGGTGILSFFAAQQGAEVICVERNPDLVREARKFLANNLESNQVRVVQADAFDYVPDQPIDFVICEMLHTAMLREKQLEVIDSFKSRYLAAIGGPLPEFIPTASRLFVQPVEQSYDFFEYHAPVPMFQPAAADNDRTKPLAEPTDYSTIYYDESIPLRFSWEETIRFDCCGWLNGLRFMTQNYLSIDVARQQSIPWSNQFLILPVEPIQVTQGQQQQLGFQYSAGDTLASLQQSLTCQAVNARKAA